VHQDRRIHVFLVQLALLYLYCPVLYFYFYHNFAKLSLAILCCSFFIIYEPFLNRKSSCNALNKKSFQFAAKPPVSLYSFYITVHCLTICIAVSFSQVMFSLRKITQCGSAYPNRQVFLFRIHVWEDSPVHRPITLLLVWSPSWGIFVNHSSIERARLYLQKLLKDGC